MSDDVIELAPPETLQLEPAKEVKAIEPPKADGLVKVNPAKLDKLDERVSQFVQDVVSSELHSPVFEEKVRSIHNLGSDEIRASAIVSNRLLDKPLKSMETGGFSDKSLVSRSLLELRKTVEDLDPARQGDLLSPKKLLGILPMGDKIRDYFLMYQSSQGHINAILTALNHGQDELRKDNATIEQEKVNLWQTMEKLQQYIYVGKRIDAALDARVADIQNTDPEKARVVREELQFYVRQKVQDLLTQMAVSVQGYLALDMIRKNNLELIKGVDRATTTTVSALRTAVIVAQALNNQKLVLDQINALNTTTSNIIESTSAMLKRQTAEVHKQASSSTVDIEKLQTAFSNIYQTMDTISTFKLEALGNMQKTIDTLTTEIDRSKSYMDRVRREQVSSVAGELKVVDEEKNDIKF